MSKQARFVLYVCVGWAVILIAPVVAHLMMED